ncbi:MAG: hypothetical protein K2K63_09860 [Acetatifactor sp.]|nr:hypothetical protein [Acetatifactor sp.]
MNMEYWKRFESSGKIEDYLSFVSGGESGENAGQNASGEALNAGIYHSDGNNIETVSRRGVRQTYQPFD